MKRKIILLIIPFILLVNNPIFAEGAPKFTDREIFLFLSFVVLKLGSHIASVIFLFSIISSKSKIKIYKIIVFVLSIVFAIIFMILYPTGAYVDMTFLYIFGVLPFFISLAGLLLSFQKRSPDI